MINVRYGFMIICIGKFILVRKLDKTKLCCKAEYGLGDVALALRKGIYGLFP
jgi:hypothetical protein